jgi:DNA-binding transcriptional regulator PaaX
MAVEIGLFSQIPSKFFSSGTASSLRAPASLVFLALCEHANRHETNTFKASDKALASETGYSPRTIRDARKRLAERGLISCSREEGRSYVYTLLVYSFDWVRLEERPRQKRKPRALHASSPA